MLFGFGLALLAWTLSMRGKRYTIGPQPQLKLQGFLIHKTI